MLDFHNLLKRLATERPVFHSEADFQHALAWRLQEDYPTASVRLEYRVELPQDGPLACGLAYVDIWLKMEGVTSGIEVKYLTKGLKAEVNGEAFDLKNHGADDVRSYDVLKDVVRLERISAAKSDITGYACVLTNDPIYWQPPRHERNCFKNAFRMHENRSLSGTLAWGEGASHGTIRGRESCLALRNEYVLSWHDYSTVSSLPGGRFRYLLIGPIAAKTPA
ncbi:MAG TPA: hypothetical protein VFB38_03215 [Chthonomonadaceae bacterium]|nr:hypothetical protein [Chthonomonadaceae bacterium]